MNKDKIDQALRTLEGISIFSVEMVNPYAHHRQLLLGGGAGVQCEVVEEGEQPAVELIPESSEYDQSIIPKEEREQDVEVVITNQLEMEKEGMLPENWDQDGKLEKK